MAGGGEGRRESGERGRRESGGEEGRGEKGEQGRGGGGEKGEQGRRGEGRAGRLLPTQQQWACPVAVVSGVAVLTGCRVWRRRRAEALTPPAARHR